MLMDALLTRRRMLVAGSALAATTLLAACGDADDEPDNGSGNTADPTASPTTPPTTPPTTTPTPGPEPTLVPNPISYPNGADELVLQIYYTGGFVPQEYFLTQLPVASLYGDGRLIVEGPQIDIFPPPALPNLLVTRLNAEGMQTILALAEGAGLLDGDRVYDDLISVVTDVGYTNFFTNAGGATSLVSVYALGIADSSVPAEHQEAFRELESFLDYVLAASTSMPGSSIDEPQAIYRFERVRITSMPATEEAPGDSEVGSQEVAWPLSTPLSTFGEPARLEGSRCFVIEGADLQTLLPYLEAANTETRWESNGQLYVLFIRPLLPDEHGCSTTEIPEPGPAGYEHPSGPDELVLRIEIQGGFVPMEWWATNLPVVSLMGDGSLIGQGAQIMIYPPPALPSLTVTGLNEDGIQAILLEADAAGLLDGDRSYDMPAIADAETTVFTVNANGRTNVVSVYALSLGEDVTDIPEEEREARRKLSRFMTLMTSTSGWLPTATIVTPGQQYEFEQLQIASQPEANAPQQDDDIEPGEAQWPLATPLSELGNPYFMEMSRCFVVEGSELATLLPMLQQTNTLTRWVSNKDRYLLYLRPLMPDETGCVDPFA